MMMELMAVAPAPPTTDGNLLRDIFVVFATGGVLMIGQALFMAVPFICLFLIIMVIFGIFATIFFVVKTIVAFIWTIVGPSVVWLMWYVFFALRLGIIAAFLYGLFRLAMWYFA